MCTCIMIGSYSVAFKGEFTFICTDIFSQTTEGQGLGLHDVDHGQGTYVHI